MTDDKNNQQQEKYNLKYAIWIISMLRLLIFAQYF